MAASTVRAVGGGEAVQLPDIPREFRAVWVASVANIDWPSRRTLSTAEQQAELMAILDRAASLRLNAVILQIRPMCDALYASSLEPWSEFLTGEPGKAPDPYYDPLALAVEEAHRRGLELHAWFNPYRAKHPSARGVLPESHISRTRPELVRSYGKYLWLDPAEEGTKQLTLDVIRDVVRRYDVDGVHIDDYFYPYRSYAGGASFPDDAAWERYQTAGGTLGRDDWRRHQVNDFVQRLYLEVKAERPQVKVGISPFGIWRPGHPEGIQGMDQYTALYADARLWLRQGWCDYFTPQLYWRIGQPAQSYPRLLAWWVEQNLQGRHVWPGNFTGLVGKKAHWTPQEIADQITVTRQQSGAGGNVHFSMAALMQNREGVCDLLQAGPYARRALVPASPWLSTDGPPAAPRVRVRRRLFGGHTVAWTAPGDDPPSAWVVFRHVNGAWDWDILPGNGHVEHRLRRPERVAVVAVAAVNRTGTMGEPTVLPVGWRGRKVLRALAQPIPRGAPAGV